MNSKAEPATLETQWGGIATHVSYFTGKAPRGCVVLVHGFGEHSGRYLDSVIPELLGSGWAVLAFDLVGHGWSGGKRGHCKGYGQLLEQVRCACDEALDRHPGQPLILYGHSMGGNLVLNLVLRGYMKASGLILSSPYLRLAFRPPAWKLFAGRMLKRLAPSVTFPSGLDPAGISGDPAEVKAYRVDPLVHDRVSPNYSFPVIEAGEWALAHAGSLSIPVLIAHGTDDPIIDFNGSKLLDARCPNSSFLAISGGFHELHHDLERERLFAEIRSWLAQFGAATPVLPGNRE